MRKAGLFLGSLLLLVLIIPAEGQQTLNQSNAGSFLTGVNPRQVNFKPVDVSKYNKAFNTSNVLKQPSGIKSYNTSSFFPKISLGQWPPRTPQVSILPKSKNIFQPKPLAGKNPFDIPAKKK